MGFNHAFSGRILEAYPPLEEARRYLGVARAAYGEDDWSFYRHYCGHAAGMLAFVDGRPGEAVAILSEVAGHLLAMEIRPLAALVLLDLAEAAVVAGDAERADEAARDLVAAAAILDCPLYHGLAALASGWAALARQRPPESAEAQQAVDVPRSRTDDPGGRCASRLAARANERRLATATVSVGVA